MTETVCPEINLQLPILASNAGNNHASLTTELDNQWHNFGNRKSLLRYANNVTVHGTNILSVRLHPQSGNACLTVQDSPTTPFGFKVNASYKTWKEGENPVKGMTSFLESIENAGGTYRRRLILPTGLIHLASSVIRRLTDGQDPSVKPVSQKITFANGGQPIGTYKATLITNQNTLSLNTDITQQARSAVLEFSIQPSPDFLNIRDDISLLWDRVMTARNEIGEKIMQPIN